LYKARKQSTSRNERLVEKVVGNRGKPYFQPRYIKDSCLNQTRKVETMALKRVIMKYRNSKHRVSRILRPYYV
jgi:hypothetical protein